MAGTKRMESSDHWDFLELIEAPMWVDLTIEAQLMENDSDDAWFRTSHPIHQMSSRQLRSSSSHDNGKCLSPKNSDSVSRSRGKHYKSRRWEDNGQDSPLIKKGNARKLNGRSLGTTLEKVASSSSSTCTVTISSSCRNPLSNLVKKIGETYSAAENTLSNSAATNYKSFRSKSSTAGPGSISNVKKQSSIMVCNSTDGGIRKTGKSTGKALMGKETDGGIRKTGKSAGKALMSKEVMQNCKSSAGKSSVGSSSTLGPILEVVNSGVPGNIRNAKKQSSRMVCNSTDGESGKTGNSTRKALMGKEVLQNQKSSAGKSSVGSSSTLGPILEVVNSGGPGSICNTKKQSSRMVCNSTDGENETGNSTGKVMMGEGVLQNQKASAGKSKSSVGSSSTLGPILEVVHSGGLGSICNAKKQSSRTVCNSTKRYGRKTVNSTGNVKKDKEIVQNRSSSTGKSSVGSSCSLGPILEVVNSDQMKSAGGKRDKNGLDSSVQASKKYVEGRISFAGCQDRPRGQRPASQELNSKDLRSVAPRKPLTLLNESRATKEFGIEPRKINGIKKLGPAYNKDKTTERKKLQNSEAIERPRQSSGCVRKNSGPLQNKENTMNGKLLNSEAMRRKTLFSITKGKSNSNMQARNSVAVVSVTCVR